MNKIQRMTRQKKVILDILKSVDCHPTADWIYEQARKQIPDLSLGTVYRNLNLLKEMGEIMELNYGGSYRCFDGIPENHYHYRCRICQRIYDMDMPLLDQLSGMLETAEGHGVETHRLEFCGVCKDCREAGSVSRAL